MVAVGSIFLIAILSFSSSLALPVRREASIEAIQTLIGGLYIFRDVAVRILDKLEKDRRQSD